MLGNQYRLARFYSCNVKKADKIILEDCVQRIWSSRLCIIISNVMLTHLHELKLPSDVATCHAWNSDGSLLACCHGSPVVAIYSIQLGSNKPIQQVASLREHNQVVSSMQWSKSNLLVTCSHDRSSYVWVKVCFQKNGYNMLDTEQQTLQVNIQDGDTWTQQMVMGRLHRAALCVEWAPNGKKFAIGSGTYNCCVCSYEEENKWWGGRVIRKAHNSSVISVAWHPDSIKLATGSTDGYCRVFHAGATGMQAKENRQFGELLASINLQCWVNSVAWDPLGQTLVLAGHDAKVHVWEFENARVSSPHHCVLWARVLGVFVEESAHAVPLPGLPATCAVYLDAIHIVCGGWDGVLHVLQKQGSSWIVSSVRGGTLQEPAEGGFSARILSMLPWNQGKPSENGEGSTSQQGACIQQISPLQGASSDSAQVLVTFSVLDRNSVLNLWQWSSGECKSIPASDT